MGLSKEAIEEFRRIWEEEYGESISAAEASEKASKFMSLFKTVYKPIHNEEENRKAA